MIVVRIRPNEDINIQADRWEHGSDGHLDCLQGDKVVASFQPSYWYAVYESGAVTKSQNVRPMPFRFHDHPGQ